MMRKDQLHVLAVHAPAARDPQTRPPRTKAPPPDDLARAIAALRRAEAAMATPRPPVGDLPARHGLVPDAAPEDDFTLIGAPRWRAGPGRGGGGGGGTGTGVRAGTARPDDDTATVGPGPGPQTDRDATARRITCVFLPDFPIERWLRWSTAQGDAPPDDLPVVLATEGTHGPVVHACTRAARQAGVHIGARVVDMRALCPELIVHYADPGGDAAALGRLALWARRWCPWTAVDGTTGLMLDTTGSDHLWGGEAEMLRRIEADLSGLGLSARLATAPTQGAAWALARFGGVRALCPADQLAAQMAPLPARALRLDEDTLLLLKRLGLKTVGDLAAVPRVSLARRFGQSALAQNPLLRLDQMMGRLAEPVSAPDEPPRFAVQSRLAEPVADPTPHLPGLCATLCDGLADAGFGARRVTLTVYRTDGEVRHITVATAHASRDAPHLLRLFDGKLERIDPGFGFDLITLAATQAEALSDVQTRLDGRPDAGAALARLVDRLSARLGDAAIRSPAPHPSHMPERAEIWPRAMAQAPRPAALRSLRPARLFDTPEEVRVLYAVPEGPPAQFVWRRVTHRVVRFAGPERIAPEWWQDRPGTRLRDYYRVEDDRGRRIWLYRDGVLGDGRGETPRWFVHGVFA